MAQHELEVGTNHTEGFVDDVATMVAHNELSLLCRSFGTLTL